MVYVSGDDGGDETMGNTFLNGVCVWGRRISTVEYYQGTAGTGFVMAHEVRDVLTF